MVTGPANDVGTQVDGPDDHRILDAVVIGTGFAGAVTACRLAEAGWSVCVLERGRRYEAADFPRYSVEDLFADATDERSAPLPDLSRWLWSRDQGLYEIADLGDAIAVQAAGYGGGSLIYANVHLRPPYDVFGDQWPAAYRGKALEPYFDLAAYMLRVRPIPRRLEKAVQMKRAGESSGSWFPLPLAVHFGESVDAGTNDDEPVINPFGRAQRACDMRARCWRGCDRQAKNTLDLNYLARAEDAAACEVHTLTEVTSIARDPTSFKVFYRDLLPLPRPDAPPSALARGADGDQGPCYRAHRVFLCAGAVNTTRLLFASKTLWPPCNGTNADTRTILGTRFFPNSDSLAIVRNCDEPHEADYGPTITSALLYDHGSRELFDWTLDFTSGRARHKDDEPRAGTWVVCAETDARARLVHAPVLDGGDWQKGTAAGSLVLTALTPSGATGAFPTGKQIRFLESTRNEPGSAGSRSEANTAAPLTPHRHWFLVQDGGYPPDMEPLVGLFGSPLWLRRNRYLETPVGESRRAAPVDASLRRTAAGPLRLKAFVDALGSTGSAAVNPRRMSARALNTVHAAARFGAPPGTPPPQPLGIISEQLGGMLPRFFVRALSDDRNDLISRGVATALPLLARMLDDLAVTVVGQIDPSVRRVAGTKNQRVDDEQLIILARGLIRQVLQVLAGSEVAVAERAARIVLETLPDSPMKLADLAAKFVLWAIGYDTITGHTAVLLTMGRDSMRGRLVIEDGRLRAHLPSRLADRASASHEYVLRDIAATHWHGELRTNPGWTTLGNRVTVHSQGGCPMGEEGRGVTDHTGQVHGIAGLYVMDAAAFPASVGVNPSASIAAVAEYKVAEILRSLGPLPSRWSQELEEARQWVDARNRSVIDPLNCGNIGTYRIPPLGAIGLRFSEVFEGWALEIPGDGEKHLDLSGLKRVPHEMSAFREAEATALGKGNPPIVLRLRASTTELARLVSADGSLEPVRLQLRGYIRQNEKFYPVRDDSYLELFLREGARKFFRYVVTSSCNGRDFQLHGVKVLANDPGFDIWHDTSTVYFESTGPTHPLRGILRVSLDTFLNMQMRHMVVTGTTDPARQSWALIAFYQYFAKELTEVYLSRAETIRKALFELVTRIHV